MRLSPLSSGLRNFSFWYSVPCSRMVIIDASSGPCVFIDSAPSMLSPSSTCTTAVAGGAEPPPAILLGHERAPQTLRPRLGAQFFQDLVERLGVQFFFSGNAF